MIKDLKLTYPSDRAGWRTWEFENVTLNALAIAALITVISYQATAILLDLALGCKKKRIASANLLHTLVLIRKSSPLAVSNNLLRNDWLTRRYYCGDIPNTTAIARDPTPIHLAVACRLLFLLAVAPFVNIASLILTLESQRTLTFAEAGFGGVALGVRPNLAVTNAEILTEFCSRTPIQLQSGDKALAEFSLCTQASSPATFWESKGLIAIGVQANHTIFLVVRIGTSSSSIGKQAVLYADGKNHIVKPVLTRRSVEGLINLGTRMVSEACGFRNASAATHITASSPEKTLEFVAAKSLPCDVGGEGAEEATRIVVKMASYLTLVGAMRLDIGLGKKDKHGFPTQPDYFDGSSYTFLSTRQRNVTLGFLGILATVFMALRVVLAAVWSNDVDAGVERIVKERLGFQCCQSMLQAGDDVVTYNNKYQQGKVARYGILQKEMYEVESFDGGVVGLELSHQWCERRKL